MLLPIHDNQPITRPPIVTVGIMVINALAFFYTLSLNEDQQNLLAANYGFVRADVAASRQPAAGGSAGQPRARSRRPSAAADRPAPGESVGGRSLPPHLHVFARRHRTHSGEHVVLLDLRQQYRRPPGAPPLPRLLFAGGTSRDGLPCRHGAAEQYSGDRGERSGGGGARRLRRDLSFRAGALPDLPLFFHRRSSSRRSPCSGFRLPGSSLPCWLNGETTRSAEASPSALSAGLCLDSL